MESKPGCSITLAKQEEARNINKTKELEAEYNVTVTVTVTVDQFYIVILFNLLQI
jgi:hypothetical protein